MTREWTSFWDHLDASDDVCTGAAALMQSRWEAELTPLLSKGGDIALADLACGSGVVGRTARAIAEASGARLSLSFVDVASAALDKVRELTGDHGDRFIEADLLGLPLEASSQDIAVSQFGLEYAGAEAFSSAARLVRPGGHLIVMSHVQRGDIWQECASDRHVLDAVLDAGVFEQVTHLLDETDAERRHAGERTLAHALASVHAQIDGRSGSGFSYVTQLLPDLVTLYMRRSAYDRAQISSWLDAQSERVTSFRDRMLSMMGAALSEADVQAVLARLTEAGLSNESCKLETGLSDDRQIAWLIKAENNQ